MALRATLEADQAAIDAEFGANEAIARATETREQASALGWLDIWKPLGVTPRSAGDEELGR